MGSNDQTLFCHSLTFARSSVFNTSLLTLQIYTASKVKHHLNIFLEKAVKLSKQEFILVTFLKSDIVVIIDSKF